MITVFNTASTQQQIVNTPYEAGWLPLFLSEHRKSIPIKTYQNRGWFNRNCLGQSRTLQMLPLWLRELGMCGPGRASENEMFPMYPKTRTPSVSQNIPMYPRIWCTHTLWKSWLVYTVHSWFLCPLRMLAQVPYAIYWPRPATDALRTLILGKQLC